MSMFYDQKGWNIGTSENMNIIYQATGVWGVTEKSYELTPIDSYIIFSIKKIMKIAQTKGFWFNPIKNGGQTKLMSRLNTRLPFRTGLAYTLVNWTVVFLLSCIFKKGDPLTGVLLKVLSTPFWEHLQRRSKKTRIYTAFACAWVRLLSRPWYRHWHRWKC